MNNINYMQNTKRKDRHGANNPMYGRTHSQESRNKMSQAATLRNQQYKKWKDSQSPLSMDEFLSSRPLKEFISKIIRKEISLLL